ncbi:MAG: HAD family hydrolase [Deltaproteobacteria bacterium]|jgi:phosphoglycolate phosphatase|nr:HAD family hydrolase [Deltaproteobacteria bacterium]
MTFEAVLFDLDGTLINTLDDIGDAVNKVLSNKGFPTHAISTYRKFVGDGSSILIKRALPKQYRKDKIIDACLKEYIEDYARNYNVKSKLYFAIPNLLDTLKAQGMKLGILSNKPHTLTKKCVNTFLSKWDFDVVFGQRESVPRKPNPQGAIEVAKTLSIPPSNFLYLGDTAIDMKTAVSAGMFPVGVLWGFRSRKELHESGAGAIVVDPLDVLNLLQGL